MLSRLVSRSISVAFTKAGGLLFSTVFLVVVARLLDPADFGEFSFFLALVSVGSAVVSGGFTHYWTRQLVADVSDAAERSVMFAVKGSLSWVLFVSSLVCLLVWAVSPLFATDLVDPFLLAAALVFSAPMAVVAGVMRARGQPAIGELPGICLVPLFSALILGIALTLDSKLAGYSVSLFYVAVLFLVGALSLRMIAAPLAAERKKSADVLFRFSSWYRLFLPFCLLSTVGVLLTQSATLVVGLLEGPEPLANYRIADRLAVMVSIPLMVLNVVVSGPIANAIYNKDIGLTKGLASRVKLLSVLAGVSIASALLLFGDYAIELFFGSAYSGATYWPMVILIASNLINVFFGSVGLILTMAGKEREVLREQTRSILLLLALLVPLTMSYGPLGAAVSVLMSTAFWNYRLHRRLMAWFAGWDGVLR